MTDTIAQTGAVLMGRKTFAMGDPDEYVGNYEFQVPIFINEGDVVRIDTRTGEYSDRVSKA